MCLAVFYNAQPRVPIYHDFLYYFGSLRIYIVSRSPIKPVNDYPVIFIVCKDGLINIRIRQEAMSNVYF